LDRLVYRLLGVKENFVSSLRVNIQAKKEGSEDRYIDNVDLFSARSRTSFASNLAYSFDLEKARVEKDLLAILEALEEERDKAFNQTEEEEIILTKKRSSLAWIFSHLPISLTASAKIPKPWVTSGRM
jgi:hypothetical protein